MQPALIGVFDSGVGGLSVLRALRQQLPAQPALYLADQAHVPYGPRPLLEVRAFAEGISRFLLAQGARVIVVACNAASAAALAHLRETFPGMPFVGMEPAVKPAAEHTLTGRVGVLATPATFQGALYASVIERFARGVSVLQDTCPGLVQQIEAGDLSSETTRAIIERAVKPMLAQGIDKIVLGCTHYPFVIPLIEEVAGAAVEVIDPAPAVARQVARVLDANGWRAADGAPAPYRFFTSGQAQNLRDLLPALSGQSGAVKSVQWENGVLRLPERRKRPSPSSGT